MGNIPYGASEEQITRICEEIGPVVSFKLVLDKETRKPKGYGFCEYMDEETALSARRNLQGYQINGRQLRVDFADNNKGTRRNREQGRSGPGFTSNIDARARETLISDNPSAATAASTTARSLGGTHGSSLPAVHNGLQNFSCSEIDPLTQYLATMSREQLNEIMSEMKGLASQNKPLIHQLLQQLPQLPAALIRAQIMLGMVPPEMMQMEDARQASCSLRQPPIQQPPPQQSQTLLQGTEGEISQVMSHRAKRQKVEDGGAVHLVPPVDTFSTTTSVPAQPIVPCSVPGRQTAQAEGLQHSEKQIPQLLPEVESALLQQVMNLTPEQLSSLPLEEQQQVFQLQQMLATSNL